MLAQHAALPHWRMLIFVSARVRINTRCAHNHLPRPSTVARMSMPPCPLPGRVLSRLDSEGRLYSPPLVEREIIASRGAGVELTRATNLLQRVLDHLLPLRDPADRARHREQHREHVGREAHRFQRDP